MQLGLRVLILRLQRLMALEDGQDMVEYALIAGLVATACVASTNAFAKLLLTCYTSITTTFDTYI